VGRNTQGVRLINLKEDEVLNSVERIAEQTLEQAGDEGSADADD
jgi:DNA gyrase/topoisomerase IV subunit A